MPDGVAVPGLDVPPESVRSWHVSWSHDGRPTVVLDHTPITRTETGTPRTVLWLHLGGKQHDVARSRTVLRFPGRRDRSYLATIDRLSELRIPRGPDEQQVVPGTRDERLGASVFPLTARKGWRYWTLERRRRRLSP
jgi:hypothetical protein